MALIAKGYVPAAAALGPQVVPDVRCTKASNTGELDMTRWVERGYTPEDVTDEPGGVAPIARGIDRTATLWKTGHPTLAPLVSTG